MVCKVRVRLVSLIASSMLLYACTSSVNTGRAFDSNRVQEIRKNETTTAQLQSMFGPAFSTSSGPEGSTVMTWYSQTTKARTFLTSGEVTSKASQLVVTVRNGIVSDFQFSQTN
jgi:outer membrane biogenesis lipoprotein LolB